MAADVNEQQIEDALAALRAFLADMNRWEQMMIEADADFDQIKTEQEYRERSMEQRQALCEIYIKHCEVGDKAKRLKDQGLSYPSDYPRHDPGNEVTEAFVKRGNVVAIVQEQYGTREQMKYELAKHGQTWLVRDNAKRFNRSTGKWVADLT